MIEAIKRVIRRSAGLATWDVNRPLKTETTADSWSQGSQLAEVHEAVEPTTTTMSIGADYYADFIRGAIAKGGRLGKHKIPVHWLRMTLAGLEGRGAGVEEMWEVQRLAEQASEIESTERLGSPFLRRPLSDRQGSLTVDTPGAVSRQSG